MVAHLVLFTPRPELPAAERDGFVRQLEAALGGIPEIARVTLGVRLPSSDVYGPLAAPHAYLAVLEFASEDALQRYLAHPVHEALAAAFHHTLDRALTGDYRIAREVRELPL